MTTYLEKKPKKRFFQEESGIDVLVHGEFERNDIVNILENKDGFALQKWLGTKLRQSLCKTSSYLW
jgi:methionine synthase II (cobalamin-independent)